MHTVKVKVSSYHMQSNSCLLRKVSFQVEQYSLNISALLPSLKLGSLIGRTRKTDRAALSYAKQQREITTFTVLMIILAYKRKALILCI